MIVWTLDLTVKVFFILLFNTIFSVMFPWIGMWWDTLTF